MSARSQWDVVVFPAVTFDQTLNVNGHTDIVSGILSSSDSFLFCFEISTPNAAPLVVSVLYVDIQAEVYAWRF